MIAAVLLALGCGRTEMLPGQSATGGDSGGAGGVGTGGAPAGTGGRDAGVDADAGPGPCCPTDSVYPAGCLFMGGSRGTSACGLVCDSVCITNWRLEKDDQGCPIWRYDLLPGGLSCLDASSPPPEAVDAAAVESHPDAPGAE
jgi:hypothetical protein